MDDVQQVLRSILDDYPPGTIKRHAILSVLDDDSDIQEIEDSYPEYVVSVDWSVNDGWSAFARSSRFSISVYNCISRSEALERLEDELE